MTDQDLKHILIDYARRTYERGLVGGTGGNFSARLSNGRMAITASGLNLGDTSMENLIEMDITTYEYEPNGPYGPSKEYLFHADILRLRPDGSWLADEQVSLVYGAPVGRESRAENRRTAAGGLAQGGGHRPDVALRC